MKVQPFLEANLYARATSAGAGQKVVGSRGESAVLGQPPGNQSLPLREGAARVGHLSAEVQAQAAPYAAGANELTRELTPVNVNPRHATAIDTFLNVAHYSGGDSIINLYA